MKKNRGLFIMVILFVSAISFGQTKITGTVVDETGEPLPGAGIVEKGTTNGTATDFDGKFTLNAKSNSGAIIVSFVGYDSKTVSFTTGGNLGKIQLSQGANTLDEVVVVGKGVIDLAGGRKTPIAVSTIKAAEIQKKIGTQDVTATLVNTPSVYVAGQSGGFGDSRIAVRGFQQDNTAYLLNGQPINGMEDGKMYWSNWSGINDIASAIQIQRGLGASKLAISSVGGTTNFVTKTTDKKEGGYIFGTIANDQYAKSTVFYNTGKSKKGFAASFMLSHWQGDGYNDGTKGQGQTYFISFGYELNDKHNFNVLLTGAPQWHDQNFSKPIEDYLTYGKRYNNNWGTYKGDYRTERRNFYHKPIANLNWDFKLNETTNLSTVLYASWGRGGASGDRGERIRTDNGLIDYDAIYAKNKSLANLTGGYKNGLGGYVTRSSMNLHNWYGLVTNFEKELNDNVTFNIGADLRTYYGEHFRVVEDFHGLTSWRENIRLKDHTKEGHPDLGTYGSYKKVIATKSWNADPYTALFKSFPTEERIAYDNAERISYLGAFTQIEYANDVISAFFQGSISNQYHQRFDFYQYADKSIIQLTSPQGTGTPLPRTITTDGVNSKKVENLGYNVKGGASYTVAEAHKVYVNAGYYSRQPYHDNIYLNFTNYVNPATSNEKILGLEAGYGYKSSNFSGNLNLYRTSWKDRVVTTSSIQSDLIVTKSDFGAEQLHQGVEIDFTYKPIEALKVKGFGSYGDWVYVGSTVSRKVDENQNVLSEKTQDVDGGQVGDAAQTTLGLGADYQITERFSVDADYRYYDRLYADLGAVKKNVQLPSYGLLDMGISYELPLAGENQSLDFRANVNNVLDKEYLSELEAPKEDRKTKKPILTGKYYKGIDTGYQGLFGYGTTWNFSIKYNF